MAKPITKSDLYDHIGQPGPHPLLFCRKCRMECSANRGDYFNLPESYTFRCCRRLMQLVIKRTIYQQVAA